MPNDGTRRIAERVPSRAEAGLPDAGFVFCTFNNLYKITPEMSLASVLANNHRYKAEPLLSKTGTGSLSPASTEDRAIEEKLSTDVTRKLMSESGSDGNNAGPKS